MWMRLGWRLPGGWVRESSGVGDVAMLAEAIIRKTCKELDIKIIDMAVNPDHVHLFIKYPPKYSVSYISEMIKGRSSRVLRKEFPI